MNPTFSGVINHDYGRSTVRAILVVIALLPMLGIALLLMELLGRSAEEPVLAGFLVSMVVWLVVLCREFMIFGKFELTADAVEVTSRRLLGRRRVTRVPWSALREYVVSTDLRGRPYLKIADDAGRDHTVYARGTGAAPGFQTFADAFTARVEALNRTVVHATAGAAAPPPVRVGRTVFQHRLARPLGVAAVLVTGALAFLGFLQSAGARWQALMLFSLALAFAVRAYTERGEPAGAPAPSGHGAGPAARRQPD